MGLIFAIQPDLRKSTTETLVLRSSKRRFSLGGGFLFGGALLGTMFLAASPLFKVLWNEGGFFDQALTAFFYIPIYLYPLIAAACWFYEEVAIVTKRADGLFDYQAWEQVFGVKWNRRAAQGLRLDDVTLENWKGAVNMAALEAARRQTTDRYATQGHWMLKIQGKILERRAKVHDIELLKAQIEGFLKGPQPSSAAPQN